MPLSVTITLADQIYIPTAGFSNRAQNQLKRIAAFRNPQYYRSQTMRMPVWNISRVICCAEYQDDYLVLPRGCYDDVADWMKQHHVCLDVCNECVEGRSIDVAFNETLREEQAAAFEALSAYDTGILSATTAFGKTVIGAALIAEKKVNTLVLVHRSRLMEQWKERLSQFLTVNEVLPPQPRRRGRQKKREIIGLYGANKDTRSGIINIAMLQSMGNADDIKPWIRDYGMVIVDECHHVPAVSFEQVLKAVHAKYIYGLTATPKRQDGHHPILNMYLGGQTNAQMKAQMAALKDTPDKQSLIICATGKFIGEGFDDSRLDTLFLTMPISWHGTLAQYVGRLHRLHEGKREVRVYDYIDSHAVMLEKMYRKRLKGYAAIGYNVSVDQQDAALGSDIISDQITFQERFLRDVAHAQERVVIVSPFVTVKRVQWIKEALQQCAKNRSHVTVVTRNPDSLPASSQRTAQTAIRMLQSIGAEVVCREGIHQKFAVIDDRTVWYGSINLLSFGASQESIMRLVSSSVARALLDNQEESK